MFPQYMCILLYVTFIWCNGIHRSIVNWGGGIYVSSVYVHSAICVIWCMVFIYYLVQWYSIDVLSIEVGGICILSICAFCYM